MAIPSYFKRLFREYVTGEGSSEVADQSPVQSVNGKTGDVTVGSGSGGVIPSSQTVASYSDLPLTDRSGAELWFVSGENDIVASTKLSPVVWRSVSDYTLVASTGPPDITNLQNRYPAFNYSDVSTKLRDKESSLDITNVDGDPTLESGVNSTQGVRYDGNDAHDEGSSLPTGNNGVFTVGISFEFVSLPSSGRDVALHNGDVSSSGDAGWFFGGRSSDWRLDQANIETNTFGSSDTNAHVLIVSYDGTNFDVDFDKTNEVSNTSGLIIPAGEVNVGKQSTDDRYADVLVYDILNYTVSKDKSARDEVANFMAGNIGISI